MSIFGEFVIHEDPDEDNAIYIVATSESIMYASLSEEKAITAFDTLYEIFEGKRQGELIVYEVPLDDFFLEAQDLLCLNKLLEEEDMDND